MTAGWRLPPILALPGLLLAGCASAPPGIPAMVCPTIPQPRPALRPDPLPPVDAPAGLSLAPGHWEWADGGYVWDPPEWVLNPSAAHVPGGPARWLNGFWTPNNGACVWTAGHFVL